MSNDISFILCNTSHPGNIGATARAMKNMGLTQLALVKPKVFPSEEATARASGASDVLEQARVFPSLQSALADKQLVLATSARDRSLAWPSLTPWEAAQVIAELPKESKAAVVFGAERTGLTNDELQSCHYHIQIPTSAEYASLNLSQAVQVIAYEILKATLDEPKETAVHDYRKLATNQQMHGLFEHFQEMLNNVAFLDAEHPKKLMPRIKRLFYKARLEKNEVNILRGIIKAVLSNK